MRPRRYTYHLSLNWGGDVPTCELECEVSYEVVWGSPGNGAFSGPPELYDEGSPDVVEGIEVKTIDGQPVTPGDADTVKAIIERLDDDALVDAMIQHAISEDCQ